MVLETPLRLSVLMPVRDDWSSAAELIRRLEKIFSAEACAAEIILVDDASLKRCEPDDFQINSSFVQVIKTLRLRRNLGHQRAIAIGLVHVQQTSSCDAVIVMDADGEDTAEGVSQLLRAYRERRGRLAIFAERSRRSESLLFRLFYHLYKIVHLCLTGISVRVGNFSILPAPYLNTLVVMSELWNHYAAAVFRSNLPFTMIPIPRGTRIAGTSRMNFVALVSHGLSAISVFGDVVGVRLLIGSLAGSLLAALGIVLVVMIRFFTNWAHTGVGNLCNRHPCDNFDPVDRNCRPVLHSLCFPTGRTSVLFRCGDYSLFIEEAVDIYSS